MLLNIKIKECEGKPLKDSILGQLCRVWETQIVYRTNWVGHPKQECDRVEGINWQNSSFI